MVNATIRSNARQVLRGAKLPVDDVDGACRRYDGRYEEGDDVEGDAVEGDGGGADELLAHERDERHERHDERHDERHHHLCHPFNLAVLCCGELPDELPLPKYDPFQVKSAHKGFYKGVYKRGLQGGR